MGGSTSRNSTHAPVTPLSTLRRRNTVGRPVNTILISERLTELEAKLDKLSTENQERVRDITLNIRTTTQGSTPIPADTVLAYQETIKSFSNFIDLHENDQAGHAYETTGIKIGIYRTISATVLGIIGSILIASDVDNGFDEEEARGPVLMAGVMAAGIATFNELMTRLLAGKNAATRFILEQNNAVDAFDNKIASLNPALVTNVSSESDEEPDEKDNRAELQESIRQLLSHLRNVGGVLRILANGNKMNPAFSFTTKLNPLYQALNAKEIPSQEQFDATRILLDEISKYQNNMLGKHMFYHPNQQMLQNILSESVGEARRLIRDLVDQRPEKCDAQQHQNTSHLAQV